LTRIFPLSIHQSLKVIYSSFNFLAYHNICSGIVLICDPLCQDSIKLVEKHIDLLYKTGQENKNILIIANVKFSSTAQSDENMKLVRYKFMVRIVYLSNF